ncbi:MAG: PAS domain-containing protein [Lachnospiraceae bacterium]|nr:PAS domain-containing protein [Lachnospiraceae bacterium]
MEERKERRERYSDGFALTKYTMPVVWQMADVIPGGFFIYKEQGDRELIYANKKVLEIYGCDTLDELKELTGYTFEGMVYPEDFPEVQASIDKQIDDEEGNSLDYVVYRIKRKDGEIRWVDDYGHYSYSPEYGDVYYVFISDITERKEMEDEEKRFDSAKKHLESLESNIADAISHLDNKDQTEEDLKKMQAYLDQVRSEI